MNDHQRLKHTINNLLGVDFTIYIEDGREVPFHFSQMSIFHLLGLQYITDVPEIAAIRDKTRIVRRLKANEGFFRKVQNSSFYPKIQERILSFYRVEEMLLSDRCEIIIDFDKTLAPGAKINSILLLYKTEDYSAYYMLGIALNSDGEYYPETYFVEHSKYYVSGQAFLECTITHEKHNH